jgi:hypothetical protein
VSEESITRQQARLLRGARTSRRNPADLAGACSTGKSLFRGQESCRIREKLSQIENSSLRQPVVKRGDETEPFDGVRDAELQDEILSGMHTPGGFMNSKLPVILAALIALAVGGTPAAYAAPTTDACSLLTAAQVSAALGVSVEAGKAVDKSFCEWSQQGAASRPKAVLLTILEPIGNLTPVDRFNAAKMPLPGVVKTPVSGLGDDAVYGGNNVRVALTVKKGNSAFEIVVSGFPVEESKAKEKAFAQEVLAKL